MKYGLYIGATLAISVIASSSSLAQEAVSAEQAKNAPPAQTEQSTSEPLTPPLAVRQVAENSATCELHVWPTQNYLGWNSGLLLGFGGLGALADMAAHDGKVKTVKDLMADYLGPDIQMAELNKIGIADTLKLPGYRIVIEEPTPFNEDLKNNPELKAKVKAMNARIKANQRLSNSTHNCYAELITTHIFYHKAMMYGSNLFTGWVYREFGDKQIATKVAIGQVKNPLEEFPAKTPDKVETAKLELRGAFSQDFIEYVQKKVMGAAPASR